jgi:MFS family permease
MIKKRSKLYLAGLFLTSLGSMTYAATLPALLYSKGVSALFIGLLIGSMRINAFLINSFFGHLGDRLNPRLVLIGCEFGAAVGSLFIYLSWRNWGSEWLVPFMIANNVRVFFTALQMGSVQKLGKNFDSGLNLNGGFAVKISGATNGALLFGGLIASLVFQRLTVERLVLFDALTFVANGLVLLIFQKNSDHQILKSKNKENLKFNIAAYYSHLPCFALLDILLSLALCGSNTLNVRLLQSAPELVPLMPTIFGGVAFICSFGLDKRFSVTNKKLWLLLGLSLLAQGMAVEYPLFILLISIIRNFCYWILYNSISRNVMKNSPADRFASISSGRTALSVSVLAIGEFWVGLSKNLPILFEMLWRSLISSIPVFWPKRKNVVINE